MPRPIDQGSGMVIVAAAGVAGAIVGSFLAALFFRWPAGRSIVRGRSECEHCGATVRAGDLVPILSFAMLRGRCRDCGKPIDPAHLAIELAATAVGAIAFAAHPVPLAVVSAILGWWLLILALLDREHFWLPDRLTLPLIAAGLGAAALGFGPPLVDRVIGAVSGYVTLLAVAALYRAMRGRDGLGGGDPKLFAAIGAWLGWAALPFVLVGAGLAGVAAIVMLIAAGKPVAGSTRLPLGTLMALAAWSLWLIGTQPGGFIQALAI